ncbi:hypothetical protein EV424DRAFT_1343129 [Suillus variegatus]|nr:hypothetical protein EV424DRAFT_1343129 [Suillus variegatus]
MFKAQLLVKINNEMKPATVSFDNYIVSFTIPHLLPSPLAITNQEDYEELIGRMQNIKKHKEIQSGKDNDSATSNGSSSNNSSDNNRKKKCKCKDKWKKTRTPKASDIDESNQPVNKNIQDLGNRWICHKKPGCETILKGPATATLKKPPNHSHFSMIPKELLGQQSVLALRCQQLDEQAQSKASSTSNTPIININELAKVNQTEDLTEPT